MSIADKLRQSVVSWNKWREENPSLRPNLDEEDFTDMNLAGANLRDASMFRTRFIRAQLRDVDFTAARLTETVFANVSLRQVKGLNQLESSSGILVDVKTLSASLGALPAAFVRSIDGISAFDNLVAPLLARTLPSVFLSYSVANEDFAQQLTRILQREGIDVFYAPESMVAGKPVRETVCRQVRSRDRFVLVLSQHSIESSWVSFEVDCLVGDSNRPIVDLIPVALDSTWKSSGNVPADSWKLKLASLNVLDFSRRESSYEFDRACQLLLTRLRGE